MLLKFGSIIILVLIVPGWIQVSLIWQLFARGLRSGERI